VHEAFLVETEARPRTRPSEFETETRPWGTNSEARPKRGTTAEATSHIHIIPRTDVVLKRSGRKPRTEAEPKWHNYRASAVAASPVLATIGMSVCPSVRLSVRHTLTLCENDAS